MKDRGNPIAHLRPVSLLRSSSSLRQISARFNGNLTVDPYIRRQWLPNL
jgi:hypothetical protein